MSAWIKEALGWCLIAVLVSLQLYNGLYVYSGIDTVLYFQNQQLCEILLCVLILLRPKGIMWLFIWFILACMLIEYADEIRHRNFQVNISDYTIPLLSFLTFGGIILLRRYNKQKKDANNNNK